MIDDFAKALGTISGFITGFLITELIIHSVTGNCVLATLLQMLMQHLK